MEATELEFGHQYDVQLKCAQDGKPLDGLGRHAEVLLFQERPGEPRLTYRHHDRGTEERVGVVGVNPRDRDALEGLLGHGRPRVCWVSERRRHRASVHVHVFDDKDRFIDPLVVGLDERIQDRARRAMQAQRAPMAQVMDWLTDEFLLPPATPGDVPRLVVSGLSRDDRSLAISLHGRRYVLDLEHREDGRMFALRLTRHRQGADQLTMVLLSAEVTFADARAATQNREQVKTQLRRLCARGSPYLPLWGQYNELTRVDLLNRTRSLGFARYELSEPQGDGTWRFHLEPQGGSREFLRRLKDEGDSAGVEIEASEEVPEVVLGAEPGGDGHARRGRPRARSMSGTPKRLNPEAYTVDLQPGQAYRPEAKPPRHGYLHYAISGQLTRLERRDRAYGRIIQGDAEMPGLALLLAGMPTTEPRPARRYAALSPATRKLFDGEPTPAQRRALGIALNTPDVALIQGPPGTGKTQLIAALQQRLLEIGESVQVHAQTLLTSEQHTAVDNVADKIRVRGLPPNRVDTRPRRGPAQSAERWRKQAIRNLKSERRPESERWSRVRRLEGIVAGYLVSPPTTEGVIEQLAEVERLVDGLVPFEMRERLLRARMGLRELLTRGRGVDPALGRSLPPLVRGIRCTAVGFADDGPRQARALLRRLPDSLPLEPTEREALAAAADGDAREEILDALSALRNRLLERLASRGGPPASPAVDPDLRELLEEVTLEATRAVRESADGVDAALAEYLDELEQDPELVERTIAGYTPVHAATCQHADSYRMRSSLPDALAFDTVIVDEAARVNPLDLMIPLSLGQTRLVLVGDHAQLPHVLDRAIEDAMRDLHEDTWNETLEQLKVSLFQHLYEDLAKIRRPERTVRLDTQFRMHPVLGAFVSRVFYEKNGEPRIDSKVGADERRHRLRPYEGDVAVWLDAGADHDGDRRVGHSWARRSEARIIAQQLAGLIGQERDLTFGVITFYSAQVRCIWEELGLLDLAVEKQDGAFEAAARVGYTKEGRPRLQVGTVDAFQGKEFDVVLLSAVRSTAGEPIDHDRPWRSYGHLTMNNRLCVAMSRARRLLIVVGDADMFRPEKAPPDVDPLTRFLEICEPPNGRLVRT